MGSLPCSGASSYSPSYTLPLTPATLNLVSGTNWIDGILITSHYKESHPTNELQLHQLGQWLVTVVCVMFHRLGKLKIAMHELVLHLLNVLV